MDTLLFSPSARMEHVESVFPTEYSSDGRRVVGGQKDGLAGAAAGAVAAGYELTIGGTTDFCEGDLTRHLTTPHKICVTQVR